jgi:capsular exopolysaccharide synthesis family protein
MGPAVPDMPASWTDLPDEGGFSIRSFLLSVKRFWWVLVLSGALGVGAAYLAFETATLVYQAEGAIWITTENRATQTSGPITQGGLLENSAWLELLTSYAVLDPVVVEQRLYLVSSSTDSLVFQDFRIRLEETYVPGNYRLEVAPDGVSYTLLTSEGVPVEAGRLGGAVGADLGFEWNPPADALSPEQVVSFSVITPRDAARNLGRTLIPTLDRQGNFIHLTLRGTDPRQTAQTLNAVMRRHVEVAAELKRAKLDELTTILKAQLETAEEELRVAEQSLEAYQVQTITLPSEETAPIVGGLDQTTPTVFGEFFNLRLEYEDFTRDRERLENALAETRSGNVRVNSYEMIPRVRESSELMATLGQLTETRAELRVLQERYTDEYGPVADLLLRIQNLEQVTIPDLAQSLLGELQVRENDLGELIDSRADELSEIPPRAIEEARRARTYRIANDLYIDLERRSSEAELAAASSIPDVRILDEAVVPQLTAADPRAKNAAVAFMAFLALGFVVVILLHHFDTKLRDPAQIGGQIGLEWLGTIPRYRKSSGGRDNSEEIREAFRDLRMKIDFAFGATRPLILSVTSPAAGEGKTFVAANLANAFADLGRKTILVDGDTRRGDLHHILGRDRKPGLTDFLMNGRNHQFIQETDNPRLHFVGFGTRSTSAPELLNSSNMQSFLAGLKRRYEVILFDCPPMAAGSDAFVLGAHTGSVLTVLRSGSTNKELAAAKMDSFLRLPVRLLGAVLNDFTPQIGQGYYRYYSNYLPGYETSDEVPEEATVVGE